MGAADASRKAPSLLPTPRCPAATDRLGRTRRGDRFRFSLVAAGLLVGAVGLVVGFLGGCSKKLSKSGSPMDAIAYDLLGMTRSTQEYYEIVLSAHNTKTFCYECTGDPYIADKSLDAVIHLGDATYDRLEGEVQVILLLSDVLVEDPIALARDAAAGSLTRLALKLPDTPTTPIADNGLRWLALAKELDAMHDANGARRQDTPGNRQRVARIADEMAAFEFPRLLLDKDGLRFFPQKAYVTQETDPTLRAAWDRAMVRRSRALIFASLEGGVFDGAPHVRSSCIAGLTSLRREKSMDIVLERLKAENDTWVRATIAEYLGEFGGPKATEALVELLRDDDGCVRHAARVQLSRLAGTDFGAETAPWEAWRAKQKPAAPPPPAPPPAPGTANPAGRPPPTPAPSGGAGR